MGKLFRRVGHWLRFPRRESHLLAREEAREASNWHWIDDAWRDIRVGVRDFQRAPRFWVSASLILGLGIGVNIAAFQLIDAMFWKPLQVREPQTLVRLFRGGYGAFPYLSVPVLEANTTIFSALLVRSSPGFGAGEFDIHRNLVWEDDPTNKPLISYVSANWFDELGYGPIRGRVFHAGVDDAPGAEPGVIISEIFWKRRLDSDPEIVGKRVRINNRVATVLGIVPMDVVPFFDTMVWMPITQVNYFVPGAEPMTAWGNDVQVYGRLRPGVPVGAVRQAMQPALDELIRQHPEAFPPGLRRPIEPSPASTRFVAPGRSGEQWIFGATAFFLTLLILLIACTNLVNLVLSRAINRIRDLSVRAVLGADRSRVFRQLLGESALLVLLSSIGGLLLVYWATRVFVLVAAGSFPGVEIVILDLNWRTIVATLLAGALAIVAVGLLPAWKISTSDLMSVIKDGGLQASAGLRSTRWRSTLIAAQIGCSCVLLVLAGNILHSVQREMSAPRVDLENVVEIKVPLQLQGIKTQDALSYWSVLQDLVNSHPQVAGTTLVAGWGNGLLPVPGLIGPVGYSEVGPGFFEVMKIPILSGREFEDDDQFGSSVIISSQLALNMYGKLDVVGEMYPKDQPQSAIVGVAENARFSGENAPDLAALYRPLNLDRAGRSLLVRANSNPAALPPLLTRMARDLNADVIPDAYLLSRDSIISYPARALGQLFSVLALMALAITCVGIFGTVSFATMLRRQEIGIRLAIGASRTSVILMFLRIIRWPLIGGIALGLATAIPSGRLFVDDSTFEDPFDLPVMAIVSIFLAVVTASAAVFPALRSLRSDPLRALRSE
jgi:putative ABC transport system permease protein